MRSSWFKTISGVAALSSVVDGAALRHRQDGLDSFVEKQRAISLQGVLNNIGPDGSQVPTAGPGIIIASPSTSDPDYVFTWTRDAALTMKMIVDEFILGKNELQETIEAYITSQATLQTKVNPSGLFLGSGEGLGEPKFMPDGERFNGDWGRPQRDGPPLRAIALITYSRWLMENGEENKAKEIVWPVISNDLSYTGMYWNTTGFDLWEEVEGSSFFATQNQYRALVQGADLAKDLGVTCTGCDQAPQVLCMLQSAYWNGEYFVANINGETAASRNGRDANVMLGTIANFDVNAQCDDPSIQPCDTRALSNFKSYVDKFRNSTLYPINANISEGSGIALGRYIEDVYYTGNPWYLITAGAAEYLYSAVAQWRAQASLTIDSLSLPFFQELYSAAEAQTYEASSSEFDEIMTAVWSYADSYVSIVEKYAPANGSLAEQFTKEAPYNPISARDLTWSYAAFITMAERRAGEFPPSWISAASTPEIPAECKFSSTKGQFEPATAAGAPDVTQTCETTVQFRVKGETYLGENILLSGSSVDLGEWTFRNAWSMSADSTYPTWVAEVALTPGETIKYGYVRSEDCGQAPIWENGSNRTLTVPDCTADQAGKVQLTVEDEWQGKEGTSGGCPGDDE